MVASPLSFAWWAPCSGAGRRRRRRHRDRYTQSEDGCGAGSLFFMHSPGDGAMVDAGVGAGSCARLGQLMWKSSVSSALIAGKPAIHRVRVVGQGRRQTPGQASVQRSGQGTSGRVRPVWATHGGDRRPRADVELDEDVPEVALHGLLADDEVGRDLPVGLPRRDEGRHLTLARGERADHRSSVRRTNRQRRSSRPAARTAVAPSARASARIRAARHSAKTASALVSSCDGRVHAPPRRPVATPSTYFARAASSRWPMDVKCDGGLLGVPAASARLVLREPDPASPRRAKPSGPCRGRPPAQSRATAGQVTGDVARSPSSEGRGDRHLPPVASRGRVEAGQVGPPPAFRMASTQPVGLPAANRAWASRAAATEANQFDRSAAIATASAPSRWPPRCHRARWPPGTPSRSPWWRWRLRDPLRRLAGFVVRLGRTARSPTILSTLPQPTKRWVSRCW